MSERPAVPEQSDLYRGLDRLPIELWNDLETLDPADVGLRAGVRYDRDRGYIVPFLGVDHGIQPGKRTIDVPPTARRPGFQVGLVLLKYLVHASDDGLSGRMVTARELNGGELFFTGPHALNTGPVITRFSRDGAGFLRAAEELGAAPIQAGDAAFRLLALPKILLGGTLYLEDDEFPARLTVTFDAHTDRHLPLDGIWALVNVMSHRLAGWSNPNHS